MRYIEICMSLLMISLFINLVTFTHIFPSFNSGLEIKTPTVDPMNSTGEYLDENSYAAKMNNFNQNSNYYTSLLGTDSNLYLAGGGDFIRAFYYFFKVFIGGTLLVFPTLITLGVPKWLSFIIVTPVYFLYALAIIQIISKNPTENAT